MIKEKEISKLVNTIASKYHPQKIILFGSYAKGNANDNSDIDLLIIKDDKLPKIERNRVVRGFINDYDLPVDIIVKSSDEFDKYKNIIGHVAYSANKYGKIVYG
jgi:predicted nucleotidyltransferase